MTISAKIIADSETADGVRVTTFLLRYPRFIHSELMTHRLFSRNASSSRAIPVLKIIEDIRRDPAMPVHWGKNQSGMQAKEEMSGWKKWAMKKLWIGGMYLMTAVAKVASKLGAHKQIVNRLIEPWSHITVVVTSTNYTNFFALRSHPDAQPEIKVLSDLMKECYYKSMPLVLKDGDWHLPFIRNSDREAAAAYLLTVDHKKYEMKRALVFIPALTSLLIRVSVSRCARTSYTLHDGKETTFEADIGLYDRLLSSKPLHASPAEHQCTPDYKRMHNWATPAFHGNLEGVIQYRKLLDGEFQ